MHPLGTTGKGDYALHPSPATSDNEHCPCFCRTLHPMLLQTLPQALPPMYHNQPYTVYTLHEDVPETEPEAAQWACTLQGLVGGESYTWQATSTKGMGLLWSGIGGLPCASVALVILHRFRFFFVPGEARHKPMMPQGEVSAVATGSYIGALCSLTEGEVWTGLCRIFFPRSTPPPPPWTPIQTKVAIMGKNEIYLRKNLVVPFLEPKCLGPRPPPPSPPSQLDAPGERRGQLPSSVWTQHIAVKQGKSGGSVGTTYPGKGQGSREGKIGQGGRERW